MKLDTCLPRANAVYEKGVAAGHHFGAQVYVSMDGKVVVDDAVGIGELEDPRTGAGVAGRPATRDDWWLWLSASKPIGAIAVAQLWEAGRFDLDAPVAETISEFAQGGKDTVTMRHILTHTAGFPNVDVEFVESTWDNAIHKVCAAPLQQDWVIGDTAGYHTRSSWYVLGEVVRRIDGRDYWRYVRESIFQPLGMMNCWIGMPAEVFDANRQCIVPSYFTEKGALAPLDMNDKSTVVPSFPPGNGRGPIRELGWYYETLLNGGQRNGARIVRSGTVDEFTRPHRVGKTDTTFQHRMDWGLGCILDSKQYGKQTVPYGYGDHASPQTFGHGGHMSVTAFADPEYRLVVAAGFNGLPGHPRHNKRVRDFCTAVYLDLELAASADNG